MKICWFNDNRLGVVEKDRVLDVSEALSVLPAPTYPPCKGDALVTHLAKVRAAIVQLIPTARSYPMDEVHFLSPVASPTKIVGVPVNYLKHVEEAESQREVFSARYQGSIEQQGFFLKATSSLVGCSDGIKTRFPDRRTDHEMELAVIIGKCASHVSEADALDHIAGYALALDMVVRGPEDRSFRKSLDSYSVLGPWLLTADEVPAPGNLDFSLAVNGQVRQASNTSSMIMDIARQISFASQFYTLWPGDIIMTGTCEGVGPVVPGDVMDCEIKGIGAMRVHVSAWAANYT